MRRKALAAPDASAVADRIDPPAVPSGFDNIESHFEFVIDHDAPPEDGLSALAAMLLNRVLARREAAHQAPPEPAASPAAKLRRRPRRRA
jgi:hypothetical protein